MSLSVINYMLEMALGKTFTVIFDTYVMLFSKDDLPLLLLDTKEY